ncbi:unnamed protein product [Callosobruchus maculatus]|uniref:Uncharacterized protein n=1 Tax=Callosobruchus maculatus TaxID=64391 RepID=A0A653BIB8_CALMS|nr:unnamed protein product [Callosobruchus maculatus]
MISKSIGIPSHFEVILISLIAICMLSLDVSVTTLQENLQEIWAYDFGAKVQEEGVEVYLKYSLSAVVLTKALTLHLFLALHFLLLWTATVEEKPNLVLPWLLLGLFRSIFLNFLGFSTGLYVCLIQKGYHPICLEYIVAQAIQHGPELYAWLSVFRCTIHLHGPQIPWQTSVIYKSADIFFSKSSFNRRTNQYEEDYKIEKQISECHHRICYRQCDKPHKTN